jgi:RHS repeat-associated protein
LIWIFSLVLAIAIPAGALLNTPVASAQGSGEIFGTSCPTTQMCVSVGTPYQGDDAAYIVETTNGGSTWTEETPPSNAGVLEAVSCPSVQDCVAVGASTGTAAIIISTTDGGAVWTTDSFPSNIAQMTTIACVGSVCWVPAAQNNNYRTLAILEGSPGGSFTTQYSSSSIDYGYGGISCVSGSDCVIDSYNYDATYNGTAWQVNTNEAFYAATSIMCPSTSTCFGGAYDVYLTINNGVSWTDLDADPAIVADVNAYYGDPCADYGCTTASVLSISCPTVSVCVATGTISWSPGGIGIETGDFTVATSNGGLSWVGEAPNLYLACPSTAMCFSGENGGSSEAPASSQGAPVGGVITPYQLFGGGGGSAAPGTCACGTGEPVDPMTGDFYDSVTDVTIPTDGPSLNFARTYDATLAQAESASGSPGPLGYGWSDDLSVSLWLNSEYGASVGGDITVSEANGAELLFVPPSGQPASCPAHYVFPNGSSGSNSYCALPNVVASLVYAPGTSTYILTTPDGTSSTFSSTGQLTTITDRNGLVETFQYSTPSPGSGSCPASAASCDLVTSAGGRSLTVAFDSSGQLTEAVEPNGEAFQYAYDGADNLVGVTDPDENVTTYTYDESNPNANLRHDLLTITYPNGQPGGPDAGDKLTNLYNSSGQVTSQTDPAGLTTSFNYSAMNESTATGTALVTDGTGSVTSYVYNEGYLEFETEAYGTPAAATESFAYDPNTLLPTGTISFDSEVTTKTYDADGDVLTSTDGNGKETTYTYNGFGEMLTDTPPLGAETVNTYDSHGNLQTSTVEGEQVSGNLAPNLLTTYAYNDPVHPAEPTSVTDPDGHVVSYTYDTAGDVASEVVSPSSGVDDTTTFAYDSNGQLYCETSPDGTAAGVVCPAFGQPRVADTTSYVRDNDGRVTSLIDPDGDTASTSYDGDGNVTLSTDPNGAQTSQTYDADDRLVTETVGSNGSTPAETSYAYDISPGTGACSSSVTGVQYCDTTTDPNGKVTVDYYNAADQMIEESRPGPIVTSYAYDGAGKVLSTTDAEGRVTSYTYNGDGNLLTVAYSDGVTPNESFAYNADRQRTTMTDGTGTTSYTYDGDDRLVSLKNGAGVTVTYGYDDDDNVTCIGYPGATTSCADSGNTSGTDLVNRTYDGAGELASVTDWLGNGTTFSYDKDGNLTGVAYPDSDSVASTFDDADQMTGTDVAPTANPSNPLASISYPLDNAGLISKEEDTGDLAGTTTYGYDGNERLSSVNTSNLTYDGDGNLKTTVSGATQNFNASDELTSSTTSSGTTNYGYDAIGDRTSVTSPTGAVTDYSYNEADELTMATAPVPLLGKVSTSSDHSLVVTSSGKVSAFGTNTYGEIGNGTTTTAKTPVTLTSPTGVSQVAAGQYFSLALTTSGHVYSWGENNDGQLGLGTTTNESSPQELTSLSNVVAIAAGQAFGLAVTSSGAVYSWGYNNDGQLGNGTTTTEKSPVQVSSLSGMVGVAAGQSHALAVTSSGAVYSWGLNTYGQLGNGNTTTEKSPISISGLSGVVSLAAGADHSVALTAGGNVYAWGENNDGQLGLGTTTNEETPTEVTSVSGIAAIAAGANHTLAVNSGGDVYAWGLNSSYQLGNNTTTTEESPVELTTPYMATVAAGSTANSSFALDLFGHVYEWGSNASYQLGTGSTTNVKVPTALSGETSVATALETNTYNGDGLRMSEGTTTGTVSFTWDPVTGATPELLYDGTKYYVYGPGGLPIEQVTSSSPQYFFHDSLGSTRSLLSSSGTVAATFTFTASGTLASSSGTATTPLLYAGSYFDAAINLYYLAHRYYDPQTGQFLSVDPMVDETGQPYAYTGDDPVNGSDPNGLCNSNPFSGSFWTAGNCLSGLVGSPDGGGGESVGGVIKSVASLAGAAAAVTSLVATGGMAAGVYSATDVAVTATTVYDGDTAVVTVTVESVPSAAAEASQAATYVGVASGGTQAVIDCASNDYESCAIEAGEAAFGYASVYLPFGQFTDTVIGTAGSLPWNSWIGAGYENASSVC